MPLDLRITRRSNWLDPCDDDITETDWQQLVEADPELSWLRAAEGQNVLGETIHLEAPNLATWEHPKGAEAWFDFCEGSVIIADPDELTVDKCHELARLLNACVQDGDGEVWT